MKLGISNQIVLNIRSDGGVFTSIKVQPIGQRAVLSSGSAQMAIVRLCVISDWSDEFMGDLQDYTMQKMVYTEVL